MGRGAAAPAGRPIAERVLEADRLEPGVALRDHPELLGQLALEELQRRALLGQRRERPAGHGGEQADGPLGVVGQHRGHQHLAGAPGQRLAVVGRHPGAGGERVGQDLLELGRRQARHRRGGDGLAVRRGAGGARLISALPGAPRASTSARSGEGTQSPSSSTSSSSASGGPAVSSESPKVDRLQVLGRRPLHDAQHDRPHADEDDRQPEQEDGRRDPGPGLDGAVEDGELAEERGEGRRAGDGEEGRRGRPARRPAGRRAAPRSRSTSLLPKARWMFPAARKSAPLVRPL